MNRRYFIAATLLGLSLQVTEAQTLKGETEVQDAVNQAHSEIWRRFVDRHGIMIDFTALDGSVSLPTPEECREGKPNALGWWAPIENGAMFNGLYMEAAVNRWRYSQSAGDAIKARSLMKGLLLLASISDVPGFVGRGVSTDGKAHYPMGSNDQTFPWFLGLWRYLESGLATPEESTSIIDKLRITAEEILKFKWRMPAEAPFGFRGGFGGWSFDSAPRLLFVAKMMHQITGEEKWADIYRNALLERGGNDKLTRLEICERGMIFEHGGRHSWTASCSVSAIRGLWELETDGEIRGAYARGLQASADLALKSLTSAEQFDHSSPAKFDPDWRTMNSLWKPQQTETEAQDLAHLQLRQLLKDSPRRRLETELVREPTAAAWIVTLAPDPEILRQRSQEVKRVIAAYDYTKLHYSQFFWAESAWWRLKAVQ